MRLRDNGNIVDFSPREGFEAPEDVREVLHYAMDGTPYRYKFGQKKRYEIPVNNISSSDKSDIESWWENKTELTFHPDYENSPGTTVDVIIVNERHPLRMMYPRWADIYEGTLILHET